MILCINILVHQDILADNPLGRPGFLHARPSSVLFYQEELLAHLSEFGDHYPILEKYAK
jgi:hypothetical protein